MVKHFSEKQSEKQIETYLRKQVQAKGGRAYKFISPGNAGVPDRIVLMPRAGIVFVECKAPGRKSTPVQAMQQKRIRDLGFDVRVIDRYAAVDALLWGMTK